jgi:hypothetical protein
MADIDIVPKRRSGTWMWVLLAVVLIALLIWMFMPSGDVANRGAFEGLATPAAQGGVDYVVAARSIAA